MSARQRKPSTLRDREQLGGAPALTPGQGACGLVATPLPLSRPASPHSPRPGKTYVFWTRLSCSLASDFCPVTRATRRGVASV